MGSHQWYSLVHLWIVKIRLKNGWAECTKSDLSNGVDYCRYYCKIEASIIFQIWVPDDGVSLFGKANMIFLKYSNQLMVMSWLGLMMEMAIEEGLLWMI